MTHGVVIGRFLPLHLGHVSLLETASELVERLSVVVATSPGDPIAASTRQGWIEAVLPNAAVHFAAAHDRSAPESLEGWGRYLRQTFGSVDRIIGSNACTRDLAVSIGANHTVLDPNRAAIAADGDILGDPASHWSLMPATVRGHFQKRLTIVGPESVGKSTIAAGLAGRFGGPHVPEYGRPYERFRHAGDYRAWELVEIARTHNAHRRALARQAGPVVFEDTDPLMTAVWCEMLLGRSVEAVEALIEQPDHYILLGPDAPWKADPIRYFGEPAMREKFFTLIRAKLEQFGASYTLVDGDFTHREARAAEIAEAMLRPGACPHETDPDAD